jgi:hypothetical protein
MVTCNEQLPQHIMSMIGYHHIYLQWTVSTSFVYYERLPHLLTVDGYHRINLHGAVTRAYTYNGWLPKFQLKMNCSKCKGNRPLLVDGMITTHIVSISYGNLTL